MTNRSTAFPYVAINHKTRQYLQAFNPTVSFDMHLIFTPDIRMAARHTRQAMEALARIYGLHGVGYKPRGLRR